MTRPESQPATRRAALAGVRVIEFGGFAAGPCVGKYLADYGAEVIRIESRTRLDGFRTHYPPYKDNIPGTERAGIFNFFNDSKRSVTLNLKQAAGLELAKRLVQGSQVVIENFSAGTMARLGLEYEVLSVDNPKLVMLSSCNQGQYGPHAQHPGFGSHLTSLSGFTLLLGYPDRSPALLYGPYIDYIAAGFGAAAVLAALRRSARTGKGCHIDLSQYETGLQFMAPAVLDFFVNGRIMSRSGNRDATMAPHGVFPCQGEEQWCALSVANDDEWQQLVEAMGRPDWAQDPQFATLAGRKAQEDRLELAITEWTRRYEREELVELLHRHGLRAYAVNSMADLFSDPQLRHRQAWRPVDHPVIGPAHVAAPPFVLRRTPAHIDRAAPCLGADNDYVLREVLGLDQQRIAELQSEGALD